MSQEIKFENDILVSTLSNPEVSAVDLFQAGLDTKNTGLLSPEEYKKSPVIQKIFSDLNNVFDEQKFNQVYKVAADKYNDLSAIKSWNDLEDDLEYSKKSIFAPLGAKTYDDRFKISRIRNPEKKAKGIDALSAWSESEYSIRELAQMNKIFDTKTQTWKDKTAEELGIFGGLISEPLVYATWDEEGEHFDEFLQRNVRHKKGEYKTDSEGNYYCETLGDREVYGKEVVAYGDILTKENSWLNKIDFFDSDGKTKSTFGTAMKTVAGVVPYLIPGFNKFYGALTASIGLAEVIPTFYKAIEGLATGDDAKRSELFKFASKQEAFMKKFNSSVSDKSKDSLFNLEQAGNLVVDIFGQLYQMRAAASVSQLFKNTRKAQDDLIKGITKAHAAELDKLPDIQRSAALNRIIKNSKEFQDLLKKSSDLASAFSLGYMALTSSADVYSDALQGGYGRRAAALAALTSVVGLYGIMRHNPISDRLGTWMLDESVGFNVGVDRKALKEALRPLYGEFKTGAEKLAAGSVKEAKKGFAGLLAKGSNIIGKTKGLFDEGFNTLTSKMLIEGVEEVTEEAVQDMTKGVFDLLSQFGFAGMEGSFGGINNVFSKQGLERYVSSFLGGAVGGGLFHLNTTYIEPFFDKKLRPDVKYSLYNEIANGNTLALLRMVDEICDKDSDLSSYTITVDGELTSGGTSSEKGVSQKEWVKNNIKEHIKSLDAIINGAELNVDDEHLVLQAVRQNELVLRYDNLGLDKLIISDRNKALANYIDAKQKYDSAKDTTEEEKTAKIELKRKAQEALDEVKAIQNGDKAEFYTNAGLILANPYVKGLLQYTDIISYTKNVYNKKYTDLSKEEKEKIEREYTDFVNGTDSGLVLEALVNTYKDLQTTYGEAFKKYGESINYRTSHKKVLDDLLTTALSSSILENQTIYGRDVIEATLRRLKKYGIEGFTLEDTLQVKNLNPDDIFSRIKNFDKVIDSLDTYLNNTSLSKSEFKEQTKAKIFNGIKSVLETLPINSINAEIITLIAKSVTNNMINEFVTNLKSNPDFSVDTFNEYLKSKKLPILPADFDLNNLNQMISDNIVLEANDDSALLDVQLQAGLSYLLSNSDNVDFQLVKSLLERIDRVFKNYIDNTITDLKVKAEVANIVHLGISNMESLSTIKNEIKKSETIKNKIQEEVDASYDSFAGITTKQEEDTDTYKQIEELFNKFDNSGFITNYEEIIKYKDKFEHNPFYDLLEKLTFQITKDGEVVNLLKVLKNEEQRINEVDSIDEYNNPSVGKETIEKLINALRTAQALVAGMLKGVMYSEQLIGINEQMNYHNKAYGDGNHLLETIDEETAILINTDINNLIDKLNYISALSNTTSESLFKNNKQIKAQYNNVLLTKYKFIFKDEDVITKEMLDILDDEISDDDYKVNMFEHYLFDAFKKYREEHGLVESVEKFFGKIKLEEADKMKSFGIGIDTNDITNKDLIIRLAAAIMQDSGEFSVIYKNIIEKNKSNSTSFVPFFTLETAIRISSAFAAERLKTSFDPKYTSVLDALNELYKTDNGYIVDFNTLFINGVAGSGKTSVVMSSVLKTLAQKAPTSLKLVIATAPSIKQIDNLKKSLSTGLTNEEITKIGLDSSENKNIDEILKLFVPSDTFTEIELSASKLKLDEDGLVSVKTGETVKLDISKVKDKIKYSGESSKKPNVIFIDEVTHVAAYKLQLLSEICKQEGIVLITSGDLSQEGKALAITTGSTTENYLSHIDSICCFQTPLIISSVRNGNIHSRNNNSKFVLALKEYLKAQAENNDAFAETALRNFLEKHPIALDYYETENELHGYKLTKTLALEDLKRLKNALEKRRTTNPNAKIGIITELDESGNIVDTAFKNQIESILKSDDFELYSYDGSHPKAAQGSEEEYVIVYNPKFDGANISDNFKKLYTMVTRSHLGAIVVSDMSNDIFKYVKNIAPKTSTGNYTLPIDSYLGKLLNERISDLENISNSTGITSVETLVDLRTSAPATVVPEAKEPEPEPEPEETSASTSSVTLASAPAITPTTSTSSTNTSITSKSNTSKSNTNTTSASTTSATTKPSSPIKPKSKKETTKLPELPLEPESKSEPEKKPSSVIAEEKNKNEKALAAEIKEVEEAEKEAGILGNDKAVVYPFYTNLSNALDGTKRYDIPLNLGDIEISYDEDTEPIVTGFTKLKNIFSAEYKQDKDTEFNNETIKARIKDLLKYAINQQDSDIKAVLYKFLGKAVSDSELKSYIQKMEISDNILLIGEYYEDSSNAPYEKVNDDLDLHLSDGRKLLTGGIKIEINGKVRYISLFKFIADTNWYLEQYFYQEYENFYSGHTNKVKYDKPLITKSSITLDLLTSRGDSRVIIDRDGNGFMIGAIELKGNFIIGTSLYNENYTNFVSDLLKRPELKGAKITNNTKFLVVSTVPNPLNESDKKYIIVTPDKTTVKYLIDYYLNVLRGNNIEKDLEKDDKNFLTINKGKTNYAKYLFSDYSLNTRVAPTIIEHIKQSNLLLSKELYLKINSHIFEKVFQYLNGDTTELKFTGTEGRAIFNTFIKGYKNKKIGEIQPFFHIIINEKKSSYLNIPDSILDIEVYPEFPIGEKNKKITSLDKQMKDFIHDHFTALATVEPRWINFPLSGNNVTSSSLSNLTLGNLTLNNLTTSTSVLTNDVTDALKQEWDTLLKNNKFTDNTERLNLVDELSKLQSIVGNFKLYYTGDLFSITIEGNNKLNSEVRKILKKLNC